MTLLKKITYLVGYLVFLTAALELFCRLSVPYLAKKYDYINNDALGEVFWAYHYFKEYKTNPHSIYEYSATRGRKLKSNLSTSQTGVRITTNNKGIRGTKNYSYTKPDDRLRIVTIGDSYTFGDEVSDQDTYPFLLQQLLPNSEVINMGVSAYGHDQMLLYYKNEGIKYNPNIVILGHIVNQNERDLRSFYFCMKPKYQLTNGNLTLTNTPTIAPQQLAIQIRYRLRLWNFIKIFKTRKSSHKKLTMAILDELVKTIQSGGGQPLFVYLPTTYQIKHNDNTTYFLKKYCMYRNVHFISLWEELYRNKNQLNLKTFHWHKKGNLVIATRIKNYIQKKIIPTPTAQDQTI